MLLSLVSKIVNKSEQCFQCGIPYPQNMRFSKLLTPCLSDMKVEVIYCILITRQVETSLMGWVPKAHIVLAASYLLGFISIILSMQWVSMMFCRI